MLRTIVYVYWVRILIQFSFFHMQLGTGLHNFVCFVLISPLQVGPFVSLQDKSIYSTVICFFQNKCVSSKNWQENSVEDTLQTEIVAERASFSFLLICILHKIGNNYKLFYHFKFHIQTTLLSLCSVSKDQSITTTVLSFSALPSSFTTVDISFFLNHFPIFSFLSLSTGYSFFFEAVCLATEIWTELLASYSWLFSDARKEPTIIFFSGGKSL